MNIQEIINHEPKLFPESADWNSFIELSNHRPQIIDQWYVKATRALQTRLASCLSEEWAVDSTWGGHHDTRIYLKKESLKSIFLGFGWNYDLNLVSELSLGLEFSAIRELLQTPTYSPILDAFDHLGETCNDCRLARCSRSFHFDTPFDGNFGVNELAWYAGNETEKFVDQAVAQIEKFTDNPNITNLLLKLNETAKCPSGTIES
jgi:hypothetical protein